MPTSRPRLAEALDLQPHPEGGWFRETWRSPASFEPPGYDGRRSAATAIYFLLGPGEESRWHRVRSDEIWLWHSGGPLELRIATPPEPGETGGMPEGSELDELASVWVLGPDVTDGQHPQVVVPGGAWQAAKPTGDEAVLVSCVVAPGFDFADFEMLR